MEKREDLLYGVLKIKQPAEKEGLRVNLDTILLAHFARPKNSERILEIGCAHGAVSLILAKRGYAVTGVDIQPHLIELAKENAAFNALDEMTAFQVMDIRGHKKNWQPQVFDRIVVNPPYDEPNRSNASPSDARATALHGAQCTLSDIVLAARYLLKNKGKLDIVLRAGRLAELFTLLEANNIAPKIMQSVHPKPGANATVVLVEAMRAASSGVIVNPPLFVKDGQGADTPELLEAYKISESEGE
ncbi:methyltransferase [Synergistaceae bacterium OttesenSCG-928-D05]|nr:methyltransferase [Synergistaceae bacterium OttesenSCG-928-D05]